jgi:hypothetical protein
MRPVAALRGAQLKMRRGPTLEFPLLLGRVPDPGRVEAVVKALGFRPAGSLEIVVLSFLFASRRIRCIIASSSSPYGFLQRDSTVSSLASDLSYCTVHLDFCLCVRGRTGVIASRTQFDR